MKKILRRFVMVIAMFFVATPSIQAQQFPLPVGMVNDFAHVLPADKAQALETKLREYRAQTNIELAVVTIPSLDGISIEEYANKLFGKWGIGQKGRDNGILILLAPKEREDRIEVGYGLEPDLTDGAASRILNERANPNFHDGLWTEGLEATVDGVIGHLGQKPFQERIEERARKREADAKAQKELDQNVLKVLEFLAIVILIGSFPAWRLYRRWRRYELRREIAKEFSQCATSIQNITNQHIAAPEAVRQLADKLTTDERQVLDRFLADAPAETDKVKQELKILALFETTNIKILESHLVEIRNLKDVLSGLSPVGRIARLRLKIQERQEAQEGSEKLLASLPERIVVVEKDGTIGASRIKKAKHNLSEAKTRIQSAGMEDWVAIYALLFGAEQLLAPPRHVSSYRPSYGSSSPGSGHHSGGSSSFGGFGGGRSGGSGASGRF